MHTKYQPAGVQLSDKHYHWGITIYTNLVIIPQSDPLILPHTTSNIHLEYVVKSKAVTSNTAWDTCQLYPTTLLVITLHSISPSCNNNDVPLAVGYNYLRIARFIYQVYNDHCPV